MKSVQHIAFNCRDLKRAEAFYTKHFGFRRARVFNRGRPDEFIMLRLGSVCLELFGAPKAAPAAAGGEQPIGFKHLAFEVEDIDATVARLQADGFETGQIIDCSAALKGLRVCFFNDPDGNRTELMQGCQDEVGA
jgi:glyoxylase I family protein